jgi:hypothetical protein
MSCLNSTAGPLFRGYRIELSRLGRPNPLRSSAKVACRVARRIYFVSTTAEPS